MFGLPAIADDLTAIAAGKAGQDDLRRLRSRLAVIPGRGACAHPDAAVALAGSALRTFERDLASHLDGRPCPAAARPIPLPIPAAGEDHDVSRAT
jgi:NADH:ubiquinone oxidoreductase subunit F (NADH-binding)